ncbi:MAG: DUF5915 domain-containing protein [Thermoplasmata archaeon]
MLDDGMDHYAKIGPKEIEDVEVLTKTTEIDINEAEKTGADLSEAKHYLEEARSHLRDLNIKQVRISVKKAQTAAADAKRYHRAELLIKHALPMVGDVRRAGADASTAESYMEKAKEALKNRMYGDLSEYVRAAKREAKEAKRYHRAYMMIENCISDVANAKTVGADVTEAEAYLDESKIALENKDYGVVSQFVKNAKKAAVIVEKHVKIEELIAAVKPEIDDIKRHGLRTEDIEEVVREAEEALRRRDYAEVRSLVRKIKRKVKRAMERKGANVLMATIEHVVHRARAKGLDEIQAMMLLDRAKKAIEKMNYAELERIISETSSMARDMNISVGSLAGDLFEKAKMVDLDKIDMVFSEAERKISAEMARARITAMRDLMTSAKELGIHEPEFQSLLDKAERAFESKDFDIIEEYKEEFEERLEEAKIKHKTEIVGMRIQNVKNMISQYKEQGKNVDEAEELMIQAEKEFDALNFEKAEELVDQAKRLADDLSKKHDAEQELGSVRDVLSEALSSGVDVAEAKDLLNQAENEVKANNLIRARELIESARNITSDNVQYHIQNRFPKLTVKLPEGGMETDVWNKCFIEIANIGDLIAKNVDITFKGDVEVKGIERIDKLDIGENMRMEIGVKPTRDGEVDMDVLLAYQRAFDDTIYQLNLAKNFLADASGTYSIEEVLLIHNSGVLISQASRKMKMDTDRDIFSSMFTAVQQFIKDSFRDRESVGLKRMDFGESKILIEHGHHSFLTAILTGGEPRYLPLYMVEVLKEVEQKYGSVLDGWRGMYSELEGVDEIISKLLQITDEKGADVEGFESGVVAATIKLIESAEKAGVSTGGEEVFVQEFIQTLEKEGFEHAWGYLERIGKEINIEISAETARETITAMEDLMKSATELGLDEAELLSFLDESEKAFQAREFDKIYGYKDAFEKRLEEAKFKHKIDIISRRIKNAMVVISQFKELGMNVDNAEELLAQADKAFKAKDFESAESDVDQAEKLVDGLRKRHDIKIELETIKETLIEIKEMQVEVEGVDDLLTQAENEAMADKFGKAKELIEKARSIASSSVQNSIQGKYPKLTLKLPQGGMEADAWNKCIIEIANIGDIIAKNVDITFKGDVEVKGVEKIDKLDVGENMRMEIGVKPKRDGEVDMNVLLAYQRAFDDTIYQLDLAKKIIADVSGTYSIDEVLLIHNSGVLITQASRRLDMDIDRDIFSSMFTAVQEFVKDSFRSRDELGLKRMDFGKNKILIEHGNYTFLTAILTGGEPRYLPLYMVEVLKEVEQKYGSILDGWRGMYSELEGIDEIINKLLQVTDEKGADVEGFESGVVASTIKLIEAAEEAGVRTGGEEAFVEEFIQTMEKEGFEHAWGYLEKIGKEVNLEINCETARETVTAMKELMNFAREWGVNETEFLSLLDKADKAFEDKDFDIIERYKDEFENKLENAKLQHKIDIIWRRIKNAMVVLSQFNELGINVNEPQKLLTQADENFKVKDFLSAEKDLDEAEKLTDNMRKRHDIKIELESIKETLSEIKEMKIEIEGVNALLTRAEKEVESNNLSKAKELTEETRSVISSNLEHLIKDRFPKLVLNLPEGGMEANVWNKCIMEVTNSGDLIAKNIDITFKGDAKVKGLERINKLSPNEMKRMEIGLKPKRGGELDMEIILVYQRSFDDTIYQLDLGKKIDVDASGTYLIEDIFLIHNNGLLITQRSRKLEEDVDKEIFSGMLSAIQDFIKDSFKRNVDVGLKRMDFGPNKILIEHGRSTFLTAIIIGGEPQLLPLYMLEVLKEVEQKYGTVLEKWDGTYSKLEGINDIIGKLMLVTDEKGAGVEGFESSAVASTIKLIEAAKEEGVQIVAPESFAQELSEVIEKEGFENAWDYLEEIGKEVKRSSEEFRKKRADLDELKYAFLGDMDDHLIRDVGDSLENYLIITNNIIKIILEIRGELVIKDTTPIKDVVIKSSDQAVRDAMIKLEIPFLNKVNAKKLEILEPDTEWEGLKLELIIHRDIISHAYKQQASKVETLLRYQSPWKIKHAIEKAGEYTLGVEGYPVKITQKMLDFKLSVPENVVVREFDGGIIYLDKELTEDMKSEGIAEELIQHINEMRKELNLKGEDYIETQVVIGDKTAEHLEKWKEHIVTKTRSYTVEFPFENIFESGESGYYVAEREIGGEKATIGIVVVEWEKS